MVFLALISFAKITLKTACSRLLSKLFCFYGEPNKIKSELFAVTTNIKSSDNIVMAKQSNIDAIVPKANS